MRGSQLAICHARWVTQNKIGSKWHTPRVSMAHITRNPYQKPVLYLLFHLPLWCSDCRAPSSAVSSSLPPGLLKEWRAAPRLASAFLKKCHGSSLEVLQEMSRHAVDPWFEMESAQKHVTCPKNLLGIPANLCIPKCPK